jgi:hypothetical protein
LDTEKVLFDRCSIQAKSLPFLLTVLLLAGCQSHRVQDEPLPARGFELADIVRADVDMVAEVNVRHSLDYLRELARKLYVRNPGEWRRGPYADSAGALRALFGPRRLRHHPGLHGKRSAAAIALAFDETYRGDRVAAFIEGMRTMLLDGYGGRERFYLYDSLDPQRLYFLARNFEIAFWKLGHDRMPDGELFLLSNSLDGSGDLSFERLAGKLIGLQDHMAQVVAEGTNRQIKNVIQSVASAVFFPI